MPISVHMAENFAECYGYKSGGNSIIYVIAGKNLFDRGDQSMHITLDSLTEDMMGYPSIFQEQKGNSRWVALVLALRRRE